jgi:lipopolysaccharide assembly LptE-like protein
MNMPKASRFTWPAAILSAAYLAAAAFAIAGCGLHFADNGSALPDTAKTIYVQRFENLTYVPGVQEQFMRYMKDAISSRGRLVVIDDPAQADLILTGKILYTGTAPASLSGAAEPLSYGNLMMIAATLTDRKTSAVVWRSNGISASSPASIVAQAIVPTTPQFLKQNLRGPDILNMTDMQVAATQEAAAQGNMMQQLAYEVYADMAWGL